MNQTKTSGKLVVLGEYGTLCGESKQDLIGIGLHWPHASDTVEDLDKIRMQLVGNYLEVFWTGLEYWNNIWTWWTEGKGRHHWYTVTRAYKNKSLLSSGLHVHHAQEYAWCKWHYLPSRSTLPATASGYVHTHLSVHTQDQETWIMFDKARVVTKIGRFCFKCVLCWVDTMLFNCNH